MAPRPDRLGPAAALGLQRLRGLSGGVRETVERVDRRSPITHPPRATVLAGGFTAAPGVNPSFGESAPLALPSGWWEVSASVRIVSVGGALAGTYTLTVVDDNHGWPRERAVTSEVAVDSVSGLVDGPSARAVINWLDAGGALVDVASVHWRAIRR